MYPKRGFTLVELLIVMIVIAILTGAMLLAQRGSEASAQATAIINDLRVMKSGVHLFLHENPDFSGSTGINYAADLGKYMDHMRIINDPVRYSFYLVGDIQWVGVLVDGRNTDTRLNAVLEGKAAANSTSMPLYGSDNIESPPPADDAANAYKKVHVAIWTVAK